MTCYELVMEDFLVFLLGENKDPLPQWWDEVYSEYIGLRENKGSSFILDITKEIIYLQTKIFIITKCVEVLATVYSMDLVLELKQCGCKGVFDWSDKTGYSNDLKAAITFAKKYKNQIEKKEKELETYKIRHGNKAIERKDFEVLRVTLFKYYGNRIDFKVITVAEWCIMLNEYDRYCEVVNAEQENLLNKSEGYGRR